MGFSDVMMVTKLVIKKNKKIEALGHHLEHDLHKVGRYDRYLSSASVVGK